jgi:hypothetical protein
MIAASNRRRSDGAGCCSVDDRAEQGEELLKAGAERLFVDGDPGLWAVHRGQPVPAARPGSGSHFVSILARIFFKKTVFSVFW